MNKLVKTINDKEYTFKFGLLFLKELDETIHQSANGVPFAVGAGIKLAQLSGDKDILALAEVLKIANKTESPRISVTDLNNWLEDGISVEELEELFDEVINVLNSSNTTALKMKALAAELKKQAEKK